MGWGWQVRIARIMAVVFLGMLLILSAGAKPTSPIPRVVQGPDEIWIATREFRPSILTVPVGTKVTWIGKDSEQHSIISVTGLFYGTIELGSYFNYTFSYTFTEAGDFEYYDGLHPDMAGAVIVK